MGIVTKGIVNAGAAAGGGEVPYKIFNSPDTQMLIYTPELLIAESFSGASNEAFRFTIPNMYYLTDTFGIDVQHSAVFALEGIRDKDDTFLLNVSWRQSAATSVRMFYKIIGGRNYDSGSLTVSVSTPQGQITTAGIQQIQIQGGVSGFINYTCTLRELNYTFFSQPPIVETKLDESLTMFDAEVLSTTSDLQWDFLAQAGYIGFGTTLNRPNTAFLSSGCLYYDTDLNDYVHWNGAAWV